MFFQEYRTIKTHACILALLLLGSFLTSSAQTRTDPKMIGDPFFELPEAATAVGIEGRIAVSLKVDKEGKPGSAEVVAGPEWPCKSNPKKELEAVRKAAKDYALGLKFEPATKNGQAVSSEILVTIATGRAFNDAVRQREAQAAAANGRPSFIRGGVVNGKALSLPKPDYPRGITVSGAVNVAVLIHEDGTVERAGAFSGHPSLHGPARDAACKAKFRPTTLQGSPIKFYGSITYVFAGPRP